MSVIKILLVNDSVDDVSEISRSMELAGYKTKIKRIDSAASLESALKDDWNVIISDYNESRFTGPEALDIINKIDPALPFILVSDNIPEDTLVDLMQAGAHDCVPKGHFKQLAQVIIRESRTSLKDQDCSHKLNELLLTVGRVNRLIVEICDEVSLLQAVCAAITTIHHYKLAWIGYVQDNSYEIKPLAYAGQERQYISSFFRTTWDDTEFGKSVTGTAIKTQQISIILNVKKGDPTQTWRQSMMQDSPAAAISLPLRVNDKIIGALTICSGSADAFYEEEVDLLDELAGDISLGIQNLRQRIELNTANEKYTALVENSNDGIVIIQEGLIKFANSMMAEMSHFLPEDFIDKPFKEFIKSDFQEYMLESYHKNLFGEPVPTRYESEFMTQDGRGIPVEITTGGIDYQDKPAVMVIIRDITERQKNEDQFRLQSQLLETNTDSVMVHDMNGKLVYANPVAYMSRGYSREEFSQLDITDLVAPDYQKNIGTHISEREQTRLSDFESLHVRKDGSTMPVDVRSSVMEFNRQQVVVSITRDISARKRADQQLRDSYKQLQQTFSGVTQAIAAIVELRDPYTAGHQLRVARLACAIADEMGLSEEVAGQIYTAGLIHDIGKISIPAEILSKPGKLNKIEFSLIQLHPQAGYEILKNIDFPFPVARWVLEHHELIDGSGYPSGLTGDKICLESKIIVVADTVEAILSHRPYRPSLGTEAALNQIAGNKDRIYDGKVVEACLRLFKEKGYHLE